MSTLKKPLSLFLVLCLLLTACVSPSPAPVTPLTAGEILDRMLAAAPEEADSYTVYGSDMADSLILLEQFYGIGRENIIDTALAQANGTSAFEIAVFRLTDSADPEGALLCCQTRLQNRQGDFFGYAPDQAELAENGLILSVGQWMALVISRDTDGVKAAFEACFADAEASVSAFAPEEPVVIPAGRTPYVDPNIDDMTLYDTSAILAAWESGNTASLSQKDAAILSAAEAVLKETVTAGMTAYEKELAVYTWLTAHVTYDWDHQNDPKRMDQDSYNPYGALINRKAVCLGFATAFQLLMDLSGVECITVVGAAFQSQEDHAWNMVRLDGDWYCVDATWDMAVPPEYFSYFNVTSEHMALTDHQWDYSAVPEATTIK